MNPEDGWLTTTRHTSKGGPDYITCEWVGGDICQVSTELMRAGGPYIHGWLFDQWFYIGPYKLRVIRWSDTLEYFRCYRDPDSFHNRVVPKLFPLYVRWVEFWRWIGPQFRYWLGSM